MSPAVEMSGDRAFARRVTRLAITSAIALGLLLFLSIERLHAGPLIVGCLAGGWVLMPSILGLSVRRPSLRYAIALPATLITLGLLTICATALPSDGFARAGWMLVTAGILMGGMLGLWFWYRLAPVPAGLDDPFSRGRWSLIGLHVALVVGGLALIAVAA